MAQAPNKMLVAATLVLLLSGGVALADAIQNGGFEEDPPNLAGWQETGGAVAAPPGSASANSAQLAPSDGVVLAGLGERYTTITQTFDCGPSAESQAFCWVKFDYLFDPISMGLGTAFVSLSGTGAVVFIPSLPVTGPGFRHVQVQFPTCQQQGEPTPFGVDSLGLAVAFGIHGLDLGSIVSTFNVDNTECKCSQLPFEGIDILPAIVVLHEVGGGGVVLCHCPPGNPNNCQTILVGESAVPSHLANHPGDHLGPCSGGGSLPNHGIEPDAGPSQGLQELSSGSPADTANQAGSAVPEERTRHSRGKRRAPVRTGSD